MNEGPAHSVWLHMAHETLTIVLGIPICRVKITVYTFFFCSYFTFFAVLTLSQKLLGILELCKNCQTVDTLDEIQINKNT